MDVVRRHHGQAALLCGHNQPGTQPCIIRQPVALHLDPRSIAAEDVGKPARGPPRARCVTLQHGRGHRSLPASRQAQQPACVPGHIFDGQVGLALASRQLPDADQPAEISISRLRFRQQGQVRAMGQGELRADDGAHDAGCRKLVAGS